MLALDGHQCQMMSSFQRSLPLGGVLDTDEYGNLVGEANKLVLHVNTNIKRYR